MENISIAAGSACSKSESSHVITAAGLPKEAPDSVLRISFCKYNTPEELGIFVQKLKNGSPGIDPAAVHYLFTRWIIQNTRPGAILTLGLLCGLPQSRIWLFPPRQCRLQHVPNHAVPYPLLQQAVLRHFSNFLLKID